MTPSLTDTLCTNCALCCDGTLFADVELAQAEVPGLEIIGLEVEDDAEGGLLSLPCGALRDRRCGIYEHRPQCCRTFECGLLQNVRQGAVSVERAQQHITDALSRIGRVKTLLAELRHRRSRLPLKERCAELLARRHRDPAEDGKRAELAAAMEGVETLIWNVFLGNGEASAARGR